MWRTEMAKKAATILAEAQQELLDTNAKLSDTGRRRDQLLLAGDERGLDAIETELAGLQKASVRQADRIRLLEEQARQEEAAAVVKRRGDLIVRFEKKLAESDREADELQNLLAQAEKKFRRIIELRTDARAAWPIGDSHTNATAGTAEGAALSGAAIKRLLSWHLYRIGARPFLGGRPGEIKEEDFPGAACPRNEVRGRPLDITPFADALRQASRFAVDMMRGKLDPLAALPPAAVVPPAASTTDETAPPGPVRSDQQERLAELLKEQARLAEDMTPAGEEMYRAIVAQIAALS
jgi:hypothetical protein